MIEEAEVYAYDFSKNAIRGTEDAEIGFWKDVGTLDAYWQTNMALVEVVPTMNLYNRFWPIHTFYPPLPPVKFVHDDALRKGHAVNSMIAAGTIVSGGFVNHSVAGYNCTVRSFSEIRESVLYNNVNVNRKAKIRRCILDNDVEIGEGVELGFDVEKDRKRKGIHVTPSGLVVVEKGARIFD